MVIVVVHEVVLLVRHRGGDASGGDDYGGANGDGVLVAVIGKVLFLQLGSWW